MPNQNQTPEVQPVPEVSAPPNLLDCCVAAGMSRVQAESFLGQLPNTDKERLAYAAMEGRFFSCLTTVRNQRTRADAVATARDARTAQPGKDGDPQSPE